MVIPTSPVNSVSYAVPENISFAKDFDKFYVQFSQLYKRMAAAINSKDIGTYLQSEIVNGQQYENPRGPGAAPGLPSSTNVNQIYRKVINFGTLPNAGPGVAAHGLADYANCHFTRIYAAATDLTTNAIPIPYINVAAPADSIQLDIGPVNVVITTTTANWIGYTECYVVIEYFKA